MTKKLIKDFIYCLGLFQGCVAKNHIVSRPTIETNPDWQMVESCGYEGCRPMVDFLSSKDIRIRIEALIHRIEKIFAIDVWFLGTDFFTLKAPLLRIWFHHL